MKNRDAPLLQNDIVLEGLVDRVVFHNPDNGFTVLRLAQAVEKLGENTRKLDDVQTAVGHMFGPKAGVRARLNGRYIENRRFGRQLAFENYEEILPATEEAVLAYLASGVIKGVGPQLAGRIVARFGEETLRILDDEPELLRQVTGIGPKNLAMIRETWAEARGMRGLHLFLQPHGISAAYAARIYKAYGSEAKAVVSSNPYRLAWDIRGIGFVTADAIAAKLGFAPDHPLRLQAAALYALQKASEDGHVFLSRAQLAEQMQRQIGAAPEQAERAIQELETDQRVKCETLASPGDEPIAAVYLSRFHHCEAKTAFYLERLLRSPKSARFGDADAIIERVLRDYPMRLAPGQIEAVRQSVRTKALVVTGGPGTGKTTIINAIIRVFKAVNARVLLAAPTGRAAKRMNETSGHEARTIHRLLEYSPKDDAFLRNEDNPLACHILIVDEASMMDTLLFYYLLKALPLGATLVLVGDVRQLPSVGPGNVLGDIIASRALPVVQLHEIFRQSAESEIICNAHLINNGQMPITERSTEKLSDFYFIPKSDPEDAASLIVELIKNHIPRRFGFDPINQIQLLTPMHKGAVGAESMNGRLQMALNPNGLEIRRGERVFRLHDKVMQVRNNYDKDIFNGDMGRIVYMSAREKSIGVDFDGSVIPYSFNDLDELTPAYAISIHKSQGSEYPAVVIPVMMQHYLLLQRNLIYTAVTRGKKLVVLVGEQRALMLAIRNNKTGKRNTWLAQRLERPVGQFDA